MTRPSGPPSGERFLFWTLLTGLGIVYLTHLGTVPVHVTKDEGRRALVPLEMCLSGDYLTPTINGEPYLRKPPFYSWLVAAFFQINGSFSPFALRLPVVLSILLLGAILFLVSRKFVSEGVAALTALAFMTNGRTLIYDSQLGLLEYTLAIFIYGAMMAVFILGEKRKYLLLFVVSYALAALGFLVKGLPALGHVGITVLVYLAWNGRLRHLFSVQHVAGILVFLAITGLFYIPFLMRAGLDFGQVASTLFSESSKRYGFKSVAEFLSNLVDFPLDFIRHFLPWTLFLVFLFRKDLLRSIRQNRFIVFNALLFVTNVPVYWMASLKNPHYLYFLLPLLFSVLFYAWEMTPSSDLRRRSMDYLFGFGIFACVPLALYTPFSHWVDSIELKQMKSLILAAGFAGLTWWYIKSPGWRLFGFVAALIWIRVAFNWFVLPQRVEDQLVFPRLASQIREIVNDQPLQIFASYPAGFYDPITLPLEIQRKEIIRIAQAPDSSTFLLVDDARLKDFSLPPLLSFPFTYADRNERYDGNMHLMRPEP